MVDRQGLLQKLLIELAAENCKLDDAELDRYMTKLIEIYQGGFRHSYSGIFGMITTIDSEDKLSIEILQQNIAFIHENYQEWSRKREESVPEDLLKSLNKLEDHINLDISRITYTKKITEEMEEKSRATNSNLKIINKKAENMQKEHVTILGIFSSIVITFVAGMVFSSSVLNNIDKVSIYRLVFIMALIALMIFNLVYLLLDFIAKINNQFILTESQGKKPAIIEYINMVLFAILFLDFVLWAIYWCRFS